MHQIFVLIFSWIFLVGSSSASTSKVASPSPRQQFEAEVTGLYQQLELAQYNLSYDAFELAIIGYSNLREQGQLDRQSLLTIIDFSKSSSEKRFLTIDLDKKQVLFYTHVAHGKNSGDEMAQAFSNRMHSLQSSLGFYKTASTYIGNHGYSMRLDGLEPQFNSRARDRAIVVHPADYVSKRFRQKYGRIGRSWGCPALPPEVSQRIIDTIKNGSCLFIYSPDKNYLSHSTLLDVNAAMSFFLEQIA